MARQRSPNYPSIGLGEAIKRLAALWEREKQTPVSDEGAAQAMGYKGLSGPSRTLLSALRKYGLIEDVGRELRVSERGIKIARPLSDSERQDAINDAALAPELFREIRDAYPDASDDNITARLVRQGYSEDGASRAVSAYRDTMGLAKLDSNGYPDSRGAGEHPPPPPPPPGDKHKESGVTVLSYSVSQGRIVDVSVQGGPLTKGEIEVLGRYLEIASEVAPESPENGADSRDPQREPGKDSPRSD